MANKYNQVVNTPHALEQCKRILEKWFTEKTMVSGEVFHFFLKPFEAPKTYKQIGAIHELCRQLSETESNEYAGYSTDYWYRYYKLRAYVPLLKIEALEKNDTALVELIESAGEMIMASRGAGLLKFDMSKVLIIYNKFLEQEAKAQKAKPKDERKSFHDLLADVAERFVKSAREREVAQQSEYSISDFIADNPAFSYADASKEHLIEVIDYMLKDGAKKGIYLKLEKQGGE